jgi:hypothetical protein
MRGQKESFNVSVAAGIAMYAIINAWKLQFRPPSIIRWLMEWRYFLTT